MDLVVVDLGGRFLLKGVLGGEVGVWCLGCSEGEDLDGCYFHENQGIYSHLRRMAQQGKSCPR